MEGVDVPTRELPENPDLEHLKNQAKSLHRAVRAEDDDALAWFASSIPVTARWPQMPGGQHILAGRRVAGDSAPVRLLPAGQSCWRIWNWSISTPADWTPSPMQRRSMTPNEWLMSFCGWRA